jgi:hypothetical protein
VDFTNAAACERAAFQAAAVDPFLDSDVRLGFELQVALPRVLSYNRSSVPVRY